MLNKIEFNFAAYLNILTIKIYILSNKQSKYLFGQI